MSDPMAGSPAENGQLNERAIILSNETTTTRTLKSEKRSASNQLDTPAHKRRQLSADSDGSQSSMAPKSQPADNHTLLMKRNLPSDAVQVDTEHRPLDRNLTKCNDISTSNTDGLASGNEAQSVSFEALQRSLELDPEKSKSSIAGLLNPKGWLDDSVIEAIFRFFNLIRPDGCAFVAPWSVSLAEQMFQVGELNSGPDPAGVAGLRDLMTGQGYGAAVYSLGEGAGTRSSRADIGVLIPFQVSGNHWVLAHVVRDPFARYQRIRIYDTMDIWDKPDEPDHYWAACEVIERFLAYYGLPSWEIVRPARLCPGQTDYYNCGVWICILALHLVIGCEIPARMTICTDPVLWRLALAHLLVGRGYIDVELEGQNHNRKKVVVNEIAMIGPEHFVGVDFLLGKAQTEFFAPSLAAAIHASKNEATLNQSPQADEPKETQTSTSSASQPGIGPVEANARVGISGIAPALKALRLRIATILAETRWIRYHFLFPIKSRL